MRKLILTLALSTVFATIPLVAAEGDHGARSPARRDAARLAAKRAEEETNKLVTPGMPAQTIVQPVAREVNAAPGTKVAFHGASDLVGKRYILEEVDGEAFEARTPVFIEWRSETDIGGKVCNTFRAKCAFHNTVVKAGEILSTRMACMDDALGKLENRLFAALREGMAFVAVGDFLEMRRDDLVLRFALDSEGKEGGDKPAAEADRKKEEPEAKKEDKAMSAIAEEDLIGKTFVLAKVDGEEFTTSMGKQPSIGFGEGLRVSGSACNNFSGPGKLEDGVLVVTNAASTMMMCVDPNLSGFERYFHKMLREGVAVSLEDGVLKLEGDGRVLEYTEE